MSRFFLWFKEMKQLYGFCPCCNELFRLSDATLYTKTLPPHTPFDTVAEQRKRFLKQRERFEDKEEAIRDEAKARGRALARRQLRKVAPFLRRGVDPNDIKVIFDPVEYLMFHGLTKEQCTLIELVDHPAETSQREKAQRSIQRTIEAGNIEWQTFRVQLDGSITQEH